MGLTENHIRYGIDHPIHQSFHDKAVVELSEYEGEQTLTIDCTQLGDSSTPHLSSPKEKKRVLREWCDYLKAHPDSFTRLSFGTRVPQELFEAACHQRRLVELRIKWSASPARTTGPCSPSKTSSTSRSARPHGRSRRSTRSC